ncbi:MAG: tetratricopeptide repeat protein, partial [Planctomycetes bacterium]|nr:tetratricopeptide repeat protein [Planctomycetota bacterium]
MLYKNISAHPKGRAGYARRFTTWSLTTLLMVTGCGITTKNKTPGIERTQTQPPSYAARFARVGPQSIDPSLSPQQIEQMSMPLDAIPLDLAFLKEISTEIPAPKSTLEPLDARKAYLRARWLMTEPDYAQAATQLRRGLLDDPNNPVLYELLAQTTLYRGDGDQAMPLCGRAIELNKNSFKAYTLLADIYANKNQHLRAVALYRRALQCSRPSTTNVLTTLTHFKLANALVQTGHPQAAIAPYTRAHTLMVRQGRYSHPDPSVNQLIQQAHLTLLAVAASHMSLGQIDLSFNALKEAQSFIDSNQDLVKLFVMSLARQRIPIDVRFKQVSLFSRYLFALDYQPRQSMLLFFKASEHLSMHDDYLAQLLSWYELDRTNDQTPRPLLTPELYALGLALASEDDQAIQILQGQLEKNITNPAAIHRDLARLYAKRQLSKQMIFHYAAYIETASDQTPINWPELKDALSRIPDPADKLKQWTTAPKSANSYTACFLIAALARLNDLDDIAEDFYRESLSLNKDYHPSRIALLDLLLESKKYDQLLAEINRHTAPQSHFPEPDSIDDPQWLWYAGQASLAMARYDKAQPFFQRIISSHQPTSAVFLALAEALYHQQNFDAAEKILQGVLDSNLTAGYSNPAPDSFLLISRRGSDLLLLNTQPSFPQVYRRLLILYALWNAQENLPIEVKDIAAQRVETFFDRWLLSVFQSASPISPAFWKSPGVEKIRQTLDSLSTTHPNGKITRLLLAELYASQKRYDQALLHIDHLITLFPQDRRVLALAAGVNENAGNLKIAADLRRRIYLLDLDDHQALLDALIAMRFTGQAEHALDLLLGAASRESFQNFITVKTLQDESLRLFKITRRLPQALKLFEQWSALTAPNHSPLIDPNDTQTHQTAAQNLVWALTAKGDSHKAHEYVLSFYQRSETANFSLAAQLVRTLNLQARFTMSTQLLNELLETHSDNLLLRRLFYETEIFNENPHHALVQAKQWVENDPNHLDYKSRQRLLVDLHHQAGEFSAAADLLNQWMQTDTDPILLKTLLIETCLIMGRLDDARELLDQLNAQTPKFPRPLDLGLKLEIAAGNLQNALDIVDRTHKDPKSPQADLLRAQLLSAADQPSRALELLEKTIHKFPDIPA